MTSNFLHGLLSGQNRAAKAAGAMGLACMLVAGCGGGSGGGGGTAASGNGVASAAPAPVTQAATSAPSATTPASSDGAKTVETPIVALPAAGNCAVSGIAAVTSPLLNSKLDCAP